MSGREERFPPTSGQFIKPLKLPVNTLQKELSEFGNRLLQTLHLPSAASVLLWLMRDTVYCSAWEPLQPCRAYPWSCIPGAASLQRGGSSAARRGRKKMPQALRFLRDLRGSPPGTHERLEVGGVEGPVLSGAASLLSP